MKRALKFLIRKMIYASIGGILFISAIIGYVSFTWNMPSLSELKNYNPPTISRFYSADGTIFAEFAKEKRIFVPYNQIPKKLVRAFVTIEDKNFFSHDGIDHGGIFRALIKNIRNTISGHQVRMGGSTITQQVAKNFFLSHAQTFTRKIKEMLLAFKIEKLYTKQKILELYLNEIYLGGGRYGVHSAADYYFNKTLQDLTLGEIAYLSILPKAPNHYNYFLHPERAIQRRNWALNHLYEEGLISEEDRRTAMAEPLLKQKSQADIIHGAYFSEMLRQDILKRYGANLLYKEGLMIKTTLDPKLQKMARTSLLKGLRAYDKKFGWRGPIGHISLYDWELTLKNFPRPKGLHPYRLAVVLHADKDQAKIAFSYKEEGIIPLKYMAWARPHIYRRGMLFPTVGPKVEHAKDVLSPGDIIAVSHIKNQNYKLEQLPEVEGAIVVLDPKTGNVLALVGGYSFEKSEFNRAVQSYRQPGSAFKTFVFLAALENGYTPESLISDEDIEIELSSGKLWRPKNITGKSYGLVPLSRALERSMNLAPLWLAQQMGISPIRSIAKRFNITSHLPPEIVTVLGTSETTLLRLTAAYATLLNGGRQVMPHWIEKIYDRHQNLIYENKPSETDLVTPEKYAYQIIKMLEKSVETGASHQARIKGQHLAGKTGSTNDYFDAWFIGFSSDLVVGVFVGFDHPKSLGKGQTGGVVAAPIFKDFMAQALKERKAEPFISSKEKVAWIDPILNDMEDTPVEENRSFDQIIPESIF